MQKHEFKKRMSFKTSSCGMEQKLTCMQSSEHHDIAILANTSYSYSNQMFYT